MISSNTPQAHKLGSSGRLAPSVQCRILAADGREANIGEKGEIAVRGENVMKGYYKNPEASAEALREGWLHTGDLGYLDEDGFLYVVGREKALLIAEDGEKYSPEEIEEAIANSSPLISQIMVYNDHRRYTVALIVINAEQTARALQEKGGVDPDSATRLLRECTLRKAPCH